MQDDLSAQLIESAEKAADLDPRVLEAYIHQCTAEAQEGSFVFCLIWFVRKNVTATFSLVFHKLLQVGLDWVSQNETIRVFSRNPQLSVCFLCACFLKLLP